MLQQQSSAEYSRTSEVGGCGVCVELQTTGPLRARALQDSEPPTQFRQTAGVWEMLSNTDDLGSDSRRRRVFRSPALC